MPYRKRYFAIRVWIIFCGLGLCHDSLAQQDSTLLDKLHIAGYFENQVLGQAQNHDYFLTDYNKLRLNLTARIDEGITFYSNINYRTYHGKTDINILDYLPPALVTQYLNQSGLSSDEAATLFDASYSNDFLFDNAYISLYRRKFQVRIGKQQLPWGTGYIWNPTNIFHTRNMLDPTYELTGVNAFKLAYLVTPQTTLTGIFSAGARFDNATYAAKVKSFWQGFDVSASYVYFQYSHTDYYTFETVPQDSHQFGADFSGSVAGVGIYGEGAYRITPEATADRHYLKALMGVNYYFVSGLYLMAEYYYNGKGKACYQAYDVNDWMNYLGPYAEGLGRQYLFAGLSQPVGNYLNVSAFILYNLSDHSYMAYPRLEYTLGNNTVLIAQVYLPDGPSTRTEFDVSGVGAMIRIRIYF